MLSADVPHCGCLGLVALRLWLASAIPSAFYWSSHPHAAFYPRP